MKKQISILLAAALLAGSSFAHQEGNHKEVGIKLPPDSPFCDNNGDGVIDASELAEGPNCRESVEGANSAFASSPIYSLGLQKGELILTIDDGPNATLTPKILDLLKSYNIKATFFITGDRIASNAQLVRRMIAEGHTVGNHTYSHAVGVTADGINGEIMRAHNEMLKILSGNQELTDAFNKRLLFRAPGLGWSSAKAVATNADAVVSRYIGPIHATLGTDAPRADWACWSQGASADTCADYYFQDIVNNGRGIILSHDIFYNGSDRNTYQMLSILLQRLDSQGGGIRNKNPNGGGVWTFKHLPEMSALDKFDTGAAQKVEKVQQNQSGSTNSTSAPTQTQDGKQIIRNFSADVTVRSQDLAKYSNFGQAQGPTNLGFTSNQIKAVVDLGSPITLPSGNGDVTFKKVQIVEILPGNPAKAGDVVYMWDAAFR